MQAFLNTITDVDGATRRNHNKSETRAADRKQGRLGLWGLIKTWEDRAHYRGQLARITSDAPELIKDIGLTVEQIEAEIAKPFWRR